MMTRRSFLKSVAGSIAALGLPIAQADALYRQIEITQKQYDAGKEHGAAIAYSDEWEAAKAHILPILHKHARACLPRGVKYEIRIKVPTNFGRDKAAAWYSEPTMQRQSIETVGKPVLILKSGHYYFGRFKA